MRPRIAVAVMIATAISFTALVLAADRARDRASDAQSGGLRFEGGVMPAHVPAPDFALRDQDGRPVSMRQYRGGPVVVTFLYTTCDETCPIQAQQIKGA